MTEIRSNFLAGTKSVSFAIKIIRSTERIAANLAMSSPCRMSTPFCSNFATKSSPVRLCFATIGVYFGVKARNSSTTRRIANYYFAASLSSCSPERVRVIERAMCHISLCVDRGSKLNRFFKRVNVLKSMFLLFKTTN